MIRTKALTITLVIVLICIAAAAVQAQDTLAQDVNGSISGFVFRDLNENGVCSDEDEPGVVGIPLQLVNRNDNTIVNLTSGGEGFYELVNASGGTWTVTVNPGAGWSVTSQQTIQIVVDEDEPDIEDVDFCIVEVGATATATPAPPPTPVTGATPVQPVAPTPVPVLPESGAAVSPSVLWVVALGLLLLVSGAALLLRTRKNNGGG
ncbi:MAG: SdrD B-like domain-containing protein [Candidatus Promineifilaceae bacterium]|jgi:LPXTG-motif cell wall-anchored protein